jgi:hypothetical protein
VKRWQSDSGSACSAGMVPGPSGADGDTSWAPPQALERSPEPDEVDLRLDAPFT